MKNMITSACALLVLAGCGGGNGGSANNPPVQASAGVTVTPPTTTAPDYTAAIAAAKRAAATDPLCAADMMGDFYWEIGDATATTPIAARSEGGGSVTASSHFNIASASKLVFGAYVLQKKGFDAVRADASLRDGMRFMSGYTGLVDDLCAGSATVGACFSAGMQGRTEAPDPNTQGKFDYDGGHDQKLAAKDLGMASFTARQIDAEYHSVIGLDADFTMAPLDVLMAGGMMGSATEYARFLQSIMQRKLVIGAHLGDDSVCALWRECPGQVAYSPIAALQEPWRYSYNHWVESEHGGGTVDAYSSPGKWGFYPWMTPDRKYYGIVARHDTHPDSYAVSVKCGRQIRKAFLGGL